jgi:fermentation-respiration switch protein FrsA (DUF1100 family)
MSVTITAVNVVPSPDASGGSIAERALPAFTASLQNAATSAMPELANPAALASELFGSLRGYLERSQNLERAIRSMESPAHTGNVRVAMASLHDGQPAVLPGPVQEPLESAGGGNLSPAARLGLAELRRAYDLALVSVHFATETNLLASGAAQFVNGVNALVKG